jgi:hypothetical protein
MIINKIHLIKLKCQHKNGQIIKMKNKIINSRIIRDKVKRIYNKVRIVSGNHKIKRILIKVHRISWCRIKISIKVLILY